MNLPQLNAQQRVYWFRAKKWGWIALAVPTFLWWKEQLWWVIAMSWYANVAAEGGREEAAEAALKAEEGS